MRAKHLEHKVKSTAKSELRITNFALGFSTLQSKLTLGKSQIGKLTCFSLRINFACRHNTLGKRKINMCLFLSCKNLLVNDLQLLKICQSKAESEL